MLLVHFCSPFSDLLSAIINTEPCNLQEWQQMIHDSSEHKVMHFKWKNIGAV